jgi:DNA-binding MarR family transcriptional regulator
MHNKKNNPPPSGMIGPRVNRIARVLRHRFNEVANEVGLFSGQQHIILLLKENEGITVSQVAEYLGITPATASVSVKRMEKAGFVYKCADEKDARITKLYLTEKGKSVPERIKEKMDAQEKFVTEGFTEEEISQLSDLLDRVINNLSSWEELQANIKEEYSNDKKAGKTF